MSIRTRISFFAASFAAMAASTPSARAQAPNATAAESLFKEGRALLEKGQVEEARVLLEKSQELDEAVGTLYNLGVCYERLGRLATAWSTNLRCVTLANTRADPRAADCKKAADALDPRLPRITISVDAKGSPPNITRNGNKVERAVYDTEVPVDPGPQEIVASAPNYKSWQTTFDIQEGDRKTVRIPSLVPLGGEPSPSSPTEKGRPMPTQTKVALGLGIGGGVILATGLVLGAVTISKWSSITEVCPDAHCATEQDRQRLDPDVQTAKTLGTISTIGVGVGAAALVGGLVLHFTTPKQTVSVTPSLQANGFAFSAALKL